MNKTVTPRISLSDAHHGDKTHRPCTKPQPKNKSRGTQISVSRIKYRGSVFISGSAEKSAEYFQTFEAAVFTEHVANNLFAMRSIRKLGL
ncbi:hypothetical protein JTE90_010421 [Oedothorax gibbosus]|uniref:Uncharacterized protein n=1 Tax=Oedothorax gibbosus TaxID=931172 RepID=A0AAV6W2C6_9ARAC|nr:hypothetical protein JTE90_010421 [Oedothorax gibbosus]